MTRILLKGNSEIAVPQVGLAASSFSEATVVRLAKSKHH